MLLEFLHFANISSMRAFFLIFCFHFEIKSMIKINCKGYSIVKGGGEPTQRERENNTQDVLLGFCIECMK